MHLEVCIQLICMHCALGSLIPQQRADIEDIRSHNINLLGNVLPEHVSDKFLYPDLNNKVCYV